MDSGNPAAIARNALERVCSGRDLACVDRFYSPSFVDHVNGAEYRGHAGITQSVSAYQRLLKNLGIEVLDQVTEADRVVCRFRVTGRCAGRSVVIDGITISRLEQGRIVEDWSVTDSISLFRQLGVVRSLYVLSRYRSFH